MNNLNQSAENLLQEGSILGIGLDHQLWTRANLNASWVKAPDKGGAVIGVTIMHDGTILGIDKAKKLVTRANLDAPWVKAPDKGGAVLGVSIMKDGTILGIDTDQKLVTRANLDAPWVKAPNKGGSVLRVTIMRDGTILGIDTAKKLVTRANLDAPWVKALDKGGAVFAVSIMKDGTILGIDSDQKLVTRANLDAPWVKAPNKGGFVIGIASVNTTMSKPYLVIQTRLMQDYHHTEDAAPKEITNHRVVITARDKGGNTIPDLKLKLYLHKVDLSQINLKSTIQIIDGNGVRNATPTYLVPVELTTSVLGQVSFNVEATETLISPVFRVHADFMENDNHGLLVFPDRHCLHMLANMNENALNGNWGTDTNRKRNPINNDINSQKSIHIVKAINKLMGNAVDKSISGIDPTVRKTNELLLTDIVAQSTSSQENIVATKLFFDPISDVTAGHSVECTDAIVRTTSMNELTSWFIGNETNGTGEFCFKDNYDLAQTFSQMSTPGGDPLSLALWNAHHNGIGLNSTNLKDKLTRTRGALDIVGEIERSVQIVVHTLEGKLIDTGKSIKTNVMVIFHSASEATVLALHTLENVAYAIEGLLKKIAVKLEDFILYIRDLFHWDDIKNTHAQMEAHLRAGIPFLVDVLPTANVAVNQKIDGLKTLVTTAIRNYEPDIPQKSISPSERKIKHQPPKDIRSSYVTHLFATNISGIKHNTADAESIVGSGKIDALIRLLETRLEPSDLDTWTNLLVNLPGRLKEGLLTDFKIVVFELVEELRKLIGYAFDMLEEAVNLFFKGVEDILSDIQFQLSRGIEIPYVTNFYIHVLTAGSKMDMYSLASLVAAVPATVIGKVALGTTHSPFPIYDANKTVKFNWPYNKQEEATKQTFKEENIIDEDAVFISSTIFGALFFTFTEIYAIANAVQRKISLTKSVLEVNAIATAADYAANASPANERAALAAARKLAAHNTDKAITSAFALSKFTLGSAWVLQICQIPVGAIAMKTDPKRILHVTQDLEISIFVLQFIPLFIESLASQTRGPVSIAGRPVPFVDTVVNGSWSIFGILHIILFGAQLNVELSEARYHGRLTHSSPDIVGIGFKGGGNIISTIPEITALPYTVLANDRDPYSKEITAAIAYMLIQRDQGLIIAWGVISMGRFIADLGSHNAFLPK